MLPTAENITHHVLWPLSPDTTNLELIVMGWFADGHDILWIPIYEVSDEPTGIADACAERAHFGGQRSIRDVTDFYTLPLGIKGLLFLAHLDDADVICIHDAPGEISFGHLQHPVTGECLTYRYDTEAPIHRQALYSRPEREL